MNRERNLFQAFILRMVNDALSTPPSRSSEMSHASTQRYEIASARGFLLRGGETFQNRCECANFNPDIVQAWAVRMDSEGWPKSRWHEARRMMAEEWRRSGDSA